MRNQSRGHSDHRPPATGPRRAPHGAAAFRPGFPSPLSSLPGVNALRPPSVVVTISNLVGARYQRPVSNLGSITDPAVSGCWDPNSRTPHPRSPAAAAPPPWAFWGTERFLRRRNPLRAARGAETDAAVDDCTGERLTGWLLGRLPVASSKPHPRLHRRRAVLDAKWSAGKITPDSRAPMTIVGGAKRCCCNAVKTARR